MIDSTSTDQSPGLVGRSFLHRELTFVLALSACGVVGFVGIRALAESNAAVRHRDAATLHTRGRDALAGGDVPRALAAFRRAARIDPANREVSFALAAALGGAGQADEAIQVLTSLRDAEPDDPDANAALARLELARGDLDEATRYYQDALDGLWMPDAAARSRVLRTEFIRALLEHGQRGRALAQTLVLSANLPPDAPDQIVAGQLFLAAGDPRRAYDRFASALVASPGDSAALAGAGEASFELGDYQQALRDLTASGSGDRQVRDMREVAELILTVDPLAPRLGRVARLRRVDRILEHGAARLDACAPAAADNDPVRNALRGEIAAFMEAGRTSRRGGDDERDRAETAVELAVRAERAAGMCGKADALSRAVPLMARAHGLEAGR